MATKRKAQEAFPKSKTPQVSATKTQLSAFAAARAAAQSQPPEDPEFPPAHSDLNASPSSCAQSRADLRRDFVASIAGAPYDGHHSSRASPETISDTEDQPEPLSARSNIQLSNIRRNGSILRDDANNLELALRPDESVTFLGEYDLEVLKGVATIYGAILHPDRGVQRVYAPSISPLPAIVARKPDTAIRVTSVEFGVQSIEHLSPLFRNLGSKDSNTNRSFTLLHTSGDDNLARALAPLEVDEGMRKVVSQLNARLDSSGSVPKIMAIGPKSSGKSTFNRVLCNAITSRPGKARCLYLDLDPGQPEFGPPGQLMLVEVTSPILGPSFTHPAASRSTSFRLLRSHTIAATSFKDDPDHYLACAADLVRHAPQDVPIVVNSCGWVSGIGASTISSLASKLSITDTVILEPVDPELANDLATITGSAAFSVPRRPRQQALRTPAELRAMQTMAYFHLKPWVVKWISKPVSSMRPWTVSYGKADAGITAVLNYGQAPHSDFLGEVLDGSIVAIVVIDDDLLDQDAIQRTSIEKIPFLALSATGHMPALDPRRSHSVGLALIRGIDVEARAFQLVTPLGEAEIANLMNKRVVLVRGSLDSPEWAYLEDLYSAKEGTIDAVEERPWVSRKEQAGIEGAVWRLRHPPMAKDVRQ